MGIEKLPMSIGQLKCLRSLSIIGCEYLQDLTEEFEKLVSLEVLELSNCPSLREFPRNFGSLCCLQDITIQGCSRLKSLPSSIDRLKCVRFLSITGCEILKGLPEEFGNLVSLEVLELSDCPSVREFPQNFGNLSHLRDITIVKCDQFKSLPSSIGQLKCLSNLRITSCKTFEGLPGLECFQSLIELDVHGCSNIKALNGTAGLISLQSLSMQGSRIPLSDTVQCIKEMPSLRILNASVDKITMLPSACQRQDTLPMIVSVPMEKKSKCVGLIFFAVARNHFVRNPGVLIQIRKVRQTIFSTLLEFSECKSQIDGENELCIYIFRRNHKIVTKFHSGDTIYCAEFALPSDWKVIKEIGLQLLYENEEDPDLILYWDDNKHRSMNERVDGADMSCAGFQIWQEIEDNDDNLRGKNTETTCKFSEESEDDYGGESIEEDDDNLEGKATQTARNFLEQIGDDYRGESSQSTPYQAELDLALRLGPSNQVF